MIVEVLEKGVVSGVCHGCDEDASRSQPQPTDEHPKCQTRERVEQRVQHTMLLKGEQNERCVPCRPNQSADENWKTCAALHELRQQIAAPADFLAEAVGKSNDNAERRDDEKSLRQQARRSGLEVPPCHAK